MPLDENEHYHICEWRNWEERTSPSHVSNPVFAYSALIVSYNLALHERSRQIVCHNVFSMDEYGFVTYQESWRTGEAHGVATWTRVVAPCRRPLQPTFDSDDNPLIAEMRCPLLFIPQGALMFHHVRDDDKKVVIL